MKNEICWRTDKSRYNFTAFVCFDGLFMLY